ncbi:MAG: aspartate aminotransferase family protein [Anaerolineales bacterium]|nr:aspartate aminotransferase family protein [Anaerolineales bacterium]
MSDLTQISYQEIEEQHQSGVYGKRPLTLVRGAGTTLWDEAGRAYLDCAAGIGVANLGHSHPRVVAAIQAQAATLITGPEFAYNDRRAELLEQLSQRLPGQMERIFLCNSGTEAVEAALKFARLSTGRSRIVAAQRGFHGRSLGALSATHSSKYREPFQPLVPDFAHIPLNDIAAAEAAIDEQTAGVIVEIIQGEGGVRPATAEFLAALRARCAETGALLIVDEIQTGFGRTGRWFACDHFDLEPDLITLGKAIGGGVPMGAVGLGPRVGGLKPGLHGSTFGGNPLACAAALAVLETLAEEGVVERAAALGAEFRAAIAALDLPVVREIRGLGLMIGLELRERALPWVKALQARGIIALTAGPNVLRFLPPLTITAAELDQVTAALAEIAAAGA